MYAIKLCLPTVNRSAACLVLAATQCTTKLELQCLRML